MTVNYNYMAYTAIG